MHGIQNYQTLYDKYRDTRLLDKYTMYSKWTVASVFPTINQNLHKYGNEVLQRDYQSLGAILVNNLTAKLAKLLFPVGVSFFRIKNTPVLQEFVQKLNAKSKSAYQKTLTEIENSAAQRILYNAGYSQIHQLLRTLIVTGNALVRRNNNSITVFSPKNFTLLRDNDGTVLDCILLEKISHSRLPQDLKLNPALNRSQEFDDHKLYTRIKRLKDGTHQVSQQIDGVPVGSPIIYAKDLCPYIPVAWSVINGDSYGHGLVQDYAGDFAKLSILSQAMAKYQIDACKVINLVKPGSTGDIDSLAAAQSGQFVWGDPQVIQKFSGGDTAFIKALLQDINVIIQRLSASFMYSANTRDAQRVTAQEIRQKVAQADQALGGVYSQLSEEIHKPLAYLLIAEYDPNFQAAIKADVLDLTVLTGTAALGRSADIQRLLSAVQVLSVLIPACTQLSRRFDTEKIIDKVLTDKGVSLEQVMKSKDQLEQEAQQYQQQMQMLQQAQAGATNAQALGGLQMGI